MKQIFFWLAFLIIGFSYGQNSYPETYFINPIKIPVDLSGNFGELRENHFHSGLDIRTRGRKGIEVFATADGYISRMNMGLYGYGNVLYIQHPNGYTTVYGHLDEFAPKIRAYIRQRQYQLKRNTLELFPKANEIPVKQGELIAYSGNSGGSGGPHLHYEIRDGQQRPLNPLLFGVKINDKRAPAINGLYVYPQEDAHVNSSNEQQSLHLTKLDGNVYQTKPIEAYGKLGFGIDALDYIDNNPFKHGLYQIETYLNGDLQMKITFDQFSFANSRYLNRYIDYFYYKDKKTKIQKLFLEPNNLVDLSINTAANKGYILIKDSLDYKMEIVLKDYFGNQTKIKIPIKSTRIPSDEIKIKDSKTTDYYAVSNRPTVFNLAHHDVFIPKDALYENTYLEIEATREKIKVHDYRTPLHKNITIGFDAGHYSKEDLAKLYVARVMPWGTKYYSDTYKEGNRITTKTRIFGDYQLEKDTTPPTITPINFRDKKWVSDLKFLELKIEDKESGIAEYFGSINGKFIVLEYDYKTGIIKYDFRDKVSDQTENNLKIIVVDNVGNSSTYEATFFRKE